MKWFTKEVKIALVAIIGLVVLYFGLDFLKGVDLFDTGNNIYYAKFKDISGLAKGSPVLTDGFQVGSVRGIDFDYDKRDEITAIMEIDNELKIPVGSVVEIKSDLLGNVHVNLIRGNDSDGFIEPEGIILGTLDAGLMGKVKEFVPVVEKLLPKIDSILTSVNYILADPALPNTLHHAEQVTHDLTATTKSINSLMSDINKEMPGLMGKADGVLTQAGTVMNNTTTLTDNLAKLDLETTLAELTKTLDNLKTFSAALNQKEGTLGLLMHDKTLYQNLNTTMMHADSLLVNLREHPKRYVHFSVFGKKDK